MSTQATNCDSAGALIDCHGITKRFGNRIAIEGADVSLQPGEVLGLVGPNGAGKSTLIRIICGLSRPDAGTGATLGMDLRRLDGRVPFVGLMTERPTFIENLTARKNLALLAGIRGTATASDIDETLTLVGLGDTGRKPVRSFSLGMRQRLSLAQAVLERPPLVVLDEPTNGLDPSGIIEMRGLIRSLAEEFGMGVLLASHLLREVEAVCDRVMLIRGGRVRLSVSPKRTDNAATFTLRTSTPDDIRRVDSMPGVTICARLDDRTAIVSPHDPAPEVLARLVTQGIMVEEWCQERSHLERMYLEVMDEAL